MAWSNTEADPRTLSGFAFDNTGSGGRTLSGNEWSNDEADPRTLSGVPPQSITTLDGVEDFNFVDVVDPIIDDSIILSGFANQNLRVIDLQEWYDNSLIGNQRASIKQQSPDNRKGIFLPGYIDNDTLYPDVTDPDAGPVTSLFPLNGSEPSDWNVLRFGFLVAYDDSLSDSANKGRLSFGIHTDPISSYASDEFGGRMYAEMLWDSLAYNSGSDRWDTSGGSLILDFVDPLLTPNNTPISSAAKNFRAFGNAGSSYFPIIVELEKNGISPLGDGLTLRSYMGLGSSAAGISDETWLSYMLEDQDSIPASGTNFSYAQTTSIAFPVDHANSYTWADFNHLFIQSFSRGIFIERVGYQILS